MILIRLVAAGICSRQDGWPGGIFSLEVVRCEEKGIFMDRFNKELGFLLSKDSRQLPTQSLLSS